MNERDLSYHLIVAYIYIESHCGAPKCTLSKQRNQTCLSERTAS